MSLPTSYLTSVKNTGAILGAMINAKAPDKFSYKFLDGLGFKSSSDRLIIAVLKAMGFLDADAGPTNRYFKFIDATISKKVVAEGVREAYADLFAVNKEAHKLEKQEVKSKLKTLTEGKFSSSVLDKMAMTFLALCDYADWSEAVEDRKETDDQKVDDEVDGEEGEATKHGDDEGPSLLRQLHYNIQIHLPETRDQTVYEAIFSAMNKHLR